jgi:acetyltransferase
MHRRGLGRALMQRLIDYARAEGIRELWGDVMAENRGMLRMCRALGFRDAPHPEETGIRRLTLPTGGGAPAGPA